MATEHDEVQGNDSETPQTIKDDDPPTTTAVVAAASAHPLNRFFYQATATIAVATHLIIGEFALLHLHVGHLTGVAAAFQDDAISQRAAAFHAWALTHDVRGGRLDRLLTGQTKLRLWMVNKICGAQQITNALYEVYFLSEVESGKEIRKEGPGWLRDLDGLIEHLGMLAESLEKGGVSIFEERMADVLRLDRGSRDVIIWKR